MTIPRSKHTISRKDISENALKVLYRLNKQGYEAYLVGGCIRDLLLGNKPKDFDITTNATPEQIEKIFRNCRLVGRRFRLAHIMFGNEIIEVATFRNEHLQHDMHTDKINTDASKQSQNGMLLRDNVYGNIEQDASRRDFTLNALYYSAKDFTLRDYCQGLPDLQNRIIRLIGTPETRYREDPVRMLRAVRFSAKLNMAIEQNTASPIKNLSSLLSSIPPARLFDESLKLLQSGYGYKTYVLLKKYHLFAQLFPLLGRLMTEEGNSNLDKIIIKLLNNTDLRLMNAQRVNPAFLFAGFFWYPLMEQTQLTCIESGLHFNDAFSLSINDILGEQCKRTAIPRRLTSVMTDIWRLQIRMTRREGKRAFIILSHPKFRAAYDLLELRASIEKGELIELSQWWKAFQYAAAEQQLMMVKQLKKHHKHKAKR